MSARLFVSNLSLHATADDLGEIFRTAGLVIVELALISDPTTGSSLGFAIVEVRNKDEARAAVDRLHGMVLNGRRIRIALAQPSSSIDLG